MVAPAIAEHPPFSILDALADEHLFGGLSAFRDLSTWRMWLVFLRAVYGLPIEGDDLETFKRHTGRTRYDPPAGGFPEFVSIVGRQAGKSKIAALVASYEAMLATQQADGTKLYALLVAQDHRASVAALFSYVEAPFSVLPLLRASVVDKKAGSLTLRSGLTVAAYPCRPAAVRGLRARVALVDELAFFIATDGRRTDTEMLRALRPALATTGGKLGILSSPYGQTGALWDLHRQHYGRDDSTTLVWQASAPEMNPSLPADYLEKMRQDDPEAFRSEVLGEFRQGVSTFFDGDALDSCIPPNIRERPPVEGIIYRAFVDPSGGSQDAFSLAIGHEEGGRGILDCVRARDAPCNPASVVEEFVPLLKSYRIRKVTGDKYAGEWPRAEFRKHGIVYEVSELDRSRIYLEMLPIVNAAGCDLLDDQRLLRELRSLERRRGTAGRDRVDHPPGQHDDVANSAAGAVVMCAQKKGSTDFLKHVW